MLPGGTAPHIAGAGQARNRIRRAVAHRPVRLLTSTLIITWHTWHCMCWTR